VLGWEGYGELVTAQSCSMMPLVRIPVKWATDSGDVGQGSERSGRWLFSYISYVAHIESRKG